MGLPTPFSHLGVAQNVFTLKCFLTTKTMFSMCSEQFLVNVAHCNSIVKIFYVPWRVKITGFALE